MSKHSECANHVRRGDVLIRVDGVDVGDMLPIDFYKLIGFVC